MGHSGPYLVQSYQERTLEEIQHCQAYVLSFNLNSFEFLCICGFQRVWKKKTTTDGIRCDNVLHSFRNGMQPENELLCSCFLSPKTRAEASRAATPSTVDPVMQVVRGMGGT